MYGTVAKMRLKPGMEQELIEELKAFESVKVPGFVRSVIYRLDAGANDYMMAVVFETKAAYSANAASPAQDARYQRMRALIESDPEWHDGEIVYGAS